MRLDALGCEQVRRLGLIARALGVPESTIGDEFAPLDIFPLLNDLQAVHRRENSR